MEQEQLESLLRTLPRHRKALNKGSGWDFDLMDDHCGGVVDCLQEHGQPTSANYAAAVNRRLK